MAQQIDHETAKLLASWKFEGDEEEEVQLVCESHRHLRIHSSFLEMVFQPSKRSQDQ